MRISVKEITSRQREVLSMISGYVAEHGYSPTLREIVRAFGWHSTRVAMGHLDALERKGAITRQRRAARTIRVLLP